MVPKLENPEYMYELRSVADNIVRERWMHSEVHAPTRTEGVESYKVPDGSDGVQPPLVAHPANDEDSIHVGPAFNIPMTQEKSLEDLPSQLDFDWQDSVPPGPSTSSAIARNLDEELHVSCTPATEPADTHSDTNKFAEVSQIAQEAVMVATQIDITTHGAADASSV